MEVLVLGPFVLVMNPISRLPIRLVHVNCKDGALTVYSLNASAGPCFVPSKIACDCRNMRDCAIAYVPNVMLGAVLWRCWFVQMAVFSHHLYRGWIILARLALAQASRNFLGGSDPADLVSSRNDQQYARVWWALLHILAEFIP